MTDTWPGWQPSIGPLVEAADAPDWLRTLVKATAGLDPESFRRYSPQVPSGARNSAVLMVLGEDANGVPDVLLQLRADTPGAHAGQVSFPGGGAEPGDAGPVDTALREAAEEVGVAPDAVRPAALLPPLYVPVSQYLVTPVLAFWTREQSVAVVDPGETAAVARIPLAHLADPSNRCSVRFRRDYVSPAFLAPGMLVWGFTAGLLTILLELGGWDADWNTEDVRELDEAWEAARALPPLTGRVQA
jgi:8-oxo-dGTP pyrophosphatase MutT (NUDIX family)